MAEDGSDDKHHQQHMEDDDDDEQFDESERTGDEPEVLMMDDGDGDDEDLLVPDEDGEEDGNELVPPADDSLSRLHAHEKDVFCLAISPDGCWLASGSEDDTTAIWDLKAQAPEPALRIAGKHVDSVNCMAWNASSTLLASADMAGRILVVPMPPGQAESILVVEDCQIALPERQTGAEDVQDEPEDSFEQVHWLLWHTSAEGILFAGCGDGSIWMWLIGRQKQEQQQLNVLQSKLFMANSKSPCMSGRLLVDAKHLLAAYEDSTARLWHLKEAAASEMKLPGPSTGAMDLHGGKGLAAIGCANGRVALANVGGGSLRLLQTFQVQPNDEQKPANANDDAVDSVECVRFAPGDLPWLAVGTANGHLAIFDWERATGRYQCEHQGQAVVDCVWRIGGINSGNVGINSGIGGINSAISGITSISLISACIDGAIRVWDARSGHPLAVLSGGDDELYALERMEQEGEGRLLLFTGCANGLIRTFEVAENV